LKDLSDKLKLEITKLAENVLELEEENARLHETRENFKNVFYSALDSILIIDGETFVDCNFATVKLLGAKNKAEVLSTHPSKLSPEMQPDGSSSFTKANKMIGIAYNKGFHRFEWMHQKMDGTPLPVEVSLTSLMLNGKQVLHTLWRDLTNRKQREKEIRKSQEEAQIANKAKSEFLASMSHELRTPINGILGAIELLQDTKVSLEQEELLTIAGNSGVRLLSLISDILDLSKIEANEVELDFVDFNIFRMVEELIAVHVLNAAKNSVEFIFNIDSEVPQFLNGDLVRICQILNNLCSNAVKFTPKGQIVLSVGLDNDNDNMVWIRFSVKDTGIGISEDNQKKLFSNFAQADSSTTRKYGGTGLGLAISKRLTELMEGKIGLHSDVESGTEIYVTIPLKKLQKRQVSNDGEKLINESLDRKIHSGAKLHILLAEDDLVNQQIAKKILEKLNYTVDIANNGEETIFKIQTFNFDIVLMDCQMPEMDGYEATREIRKLEAKKLCFAASGPHSEDKEQKAEDKELINNLQINKYLNRPARYLNKRVPIIAMTANALVGDRKKCLDAGMDDYITKPIKTKVLKEKIDYWVRKQL
jgi:signal transduction histidine kinase/CheY-like chemotaxis protein